MSSPTGRFHSTPSTDEQRYLPKTTANSGSGLQPGTSASNSRPSHPETASTISGGSTRARHRTCAFSVATLGPRMTDPHSLPRC